MFTNDFRISRPAEYIFIHRPVVHSLCFLPMDSQFTPNIFSMSMHLQSSAQLPLWRTSQAHSEIHIFLLDGCKYMENVGMNFGGCARPREVCEYEATDEEFAKPEPLLMHDKPLRTTSKTALRLYQWLQKLVQKVDEIPPIQQPMRFGNKAFRTWLDVAVIQTVYKEVLQPGKGEFHEQTEKKRVTYDEYADDVVHYLYEAFGNKQRIDYGTGHELNFVLALICMKLQGTITDMDVIMQSIFPAYLQLMRKLQTTYWLEPAGSKGAWGLDDFQFLPFLWGSAQLLQADVMPASIAVPADVERLADSSMFFKAVQFISCVKHGPFAEHSAMLYQLSQQPSWKRVQASLIRLYEEEVISKFPIVQHIRFGHLLRLQSSVND